MHRLIAGCLAATLAFTATNLSAHCPAEGPALQILGSGGPIADDGRASSGYLIWDQGRPRVLVDAGGGVFLRFGQAGASLEALDLIAITHQHTDHAADLPALLKGAYFSSRSRPLAVSGPDGNDRFPGIIPFIESMFDEDKGAFKYLSGLLDGSDGLFQLRPQSIDANTPPTQPATAVIELEDLKIEAIGVHHGPVPTLAYRIEIGGKRIVISGDQNLSREGFSAFTHGADLLIMPMAIPENAGRSAAMLHARPSAIGRLAADAEVKHLVLSHFMARSLRDLDTQVDKLREHYNGQLTLAEDLMCIDLTAPQ
ncbi:MAG: MBL fold metallo-hydrolase [Wenzhouxiangellaceae bacterium]|nr:MBL fold metallo-hydrolase [Wenzhouxiangellaceae bacterium]